MGKELTVHNLQIHLKYILFCTVFSWQAHCVKHWSGQNGLILVPHLVMTSALDLSNYKHNWKGFVINYHYNSVEETLMCNKMGPNKGEWSSSEGGWILQFDPLYNLSPLQNQHYTIIRELWPLHRIFTVISEAVTADLYRVQRLKANFSPSLPLPPPHTNTQHMNIIIPCLSFTQNIKSPAAQEPHPSLYHNSSLVICYQ